MTTQSYITHSLSNVTGIFCLATPATTLDLSWLFCPQLVSLSYTPHWRTTTLPGRRLHAFCIGHCSPCILRANANSGHFLGRSVFSSQFLISFSFTLPRSSVDEKEDSSLAKMEQKDQVRDYIEYEEVGVPSHIRRTKRPSCMERPSKFSILMVVLFILAGVANIGAWLWITRGHRDALNEEWNHCGRSSEEAMRLGCVMEPLFYGWMPKQCVYKELSDRYPVFEDRKWYLEKDMIVWFTSLSPITPTILTNCF